MFSLAAIILLLGDPLKADRQDEDTAYHKQNADRIKPYKDNPRYWQYKGEPVLLLGGSITDHIFLLEGLEEHLDEIASVGGNYVRNTMSQREGLDLKAHKRLTNGKFDLNQWNSIYWNRIRLLRNT